MTLPMIVWVLALDFLAFCALIVSITALIERRLNIGLISAAAAIVLIIGVWRLVRRSRLPGPPKVRRRT